MIRENLLNQPNAKVISEYPEVASNLYIRVLQDLERHPDAALIVDLSSDPEDGLKTLEKVRQAAPDLYIIAAGYNADGENVLSAVRSGSNDYIVLPLRRGEFKDAIGRLEKTPRRASTGESKLGKIYTFLGTKGGWGPPVWRSISPRCWRSASSTRC
jgi:Response regulator containing CheY-like receiver domain and AraC-type DNA-binding domain